MTATPVPPERNDGFRPIAGHGPRVRTDVVDVYVFRRLSPGTIEFLQLLRSRPPLEGTWHPIMGHVESGESAVACARREMAEEVGLSAHDPALKGLWALEQVHPFYIAAIDTIVMSPRFAAEVAADWKPRLNHEHASVRWVAAVDVSSLFMWPGQHAACREVLSMIAPSGSIAADRVRV